VTHLDQAIIDTHTETSDIDCIIDMIAADLKSDWEEMRASEPISRESWPSDAPPRGSEKNMIGNTFVISRDFAHTRYWH
jgi:hypothetical protein